GRFRLGRLGVGAGAVAGPGQDESAKEGDGSIHDDMPSQKVIPGVETWKWRRGSTTIRMATTLCLGKGVGEGIEARRRDEDGMRKGCGPGRRPGDDLPVVRGSDSLAVGRSTKVSRGRIEPSRRGEVARWRRHRP